MAEELGLTNIPGGPNERVSRQDNPFLASIDLMRRNGTDELTVRAYVACVYAIERLLKDKTKIFPTALPDPMGRSQGNISGYPLEGEVPKSVFDTDVTLRVVGMGKIRFIKGGPTKYVNEAAIFDVLFGKTGESQSGRDFVKNQSVTAGVTVVLSPVGRHQPLVIEGEQYHSGAQEIYCCDDPRYIFDLRKPDGALSEAENVVIYPGTETEPGNMYASFLPPAKQLIVNEFQNPKLILTDALRDRVVYAFLTLIKYLDTIPFSDRASLMNNNSEIRKLFKGWTGIDHYYDWVTFKRPDGRIDRLLSAIRLGFVKPRKGRIEELAFDAKKIVSDYWEILRG